MLNTNTHIKSMSFKIRSLFEAEYFAQLLAACFTFLNYTVIPAASFISNFKSNFHYTCGVRPTPKRLTILMSGGQGRSQRKIEGGPNFVTFKSGVIYL